MKTAIDYKVLFHGVDVSDYFQGHGIALGKFDDCATGIGKSNGEAFQNALESLAQNGWDVEILEKRIVAESFDGKPLADKAEELGDDAYYFVSIDVK